MVLDLNAGLTWIMPRATYNLAPAKLSDIQMMYETMQPLS